MRRPRRVFRNTAVMVNLVHPLLSRLLGGITLWVRFERVRCIASDATLSRFARLQPEARGLAAGVVVTLTRRRRCPNLLARPGSAVGGGMVLTRVVRMHVFMYCRLFSCNVATAQIVLTDDYILCSIREMPPGFAVIVAAFACDCRPVT